MFRVRFESKQKEKEEMKRFAQRMGVLNVVLRLIELLDKDERITARLGADANDYTMLAFYIRLAPRVTLAIYIANSINFILRIGKASFVLNERAPKTLIFDKLKALLLNIRDPLDGSIVDEADLLATLIEYLENKPLELMTVVFTIGDKKRTIYLIQYEGEGMPVNAIEALTALYIAANGYIPAHIKHYIERYPVLVAHDKFYVSRRYAMLPVARRHSYRLVIPELLVTPTRVNFEQAQEIFKKLFERTTKFFKNRTPLLAWKN